MSTKLAIVLTGGTGEHFSDLNKQPSGYLSFFLYNLVLGLSALIPSLLCVILFFVLLKLKRGTVLPKNGYFSQSQFQRSFGSISLSSLITVFTGMSKLDHDLKTRSSVDAEKAADASCEDNEEDNSFSSLLLNAKKNATSEAGE